jgi:hypothetical protein
MADTVTLIFPFPHFQAVKDGRPLIGGKLYTFEPSSSTPKSSFIDPYYITSNTNPTILDDQGAATVFLQDFYDLRLTDADDVLIWTISNYTWESGATPPAPGDKIMGSTDATVTPSPGTGVIAIPSLVPTGYRCEGLTWSIVTGMGTSGGLTGILLGDAVANDRWGRLTDLTAGQSGGQVQFRSDTTPVEPIPYVILAAAEGGVFDAVGALHVTAYWSALPADTP